jgi:hypothetical protein
VKRLALLIVLTGALGGLVAVDQAAAAPPTAVTCGSVISAPGEYYLAGDCSGAGIAITASDVRLKLNGHTMTGPGLVPPAPPDTGLSASPVPPASAVSRLDIEGPGTITGYVFGLTLDRVDHSQVVNVTSTANGADQVDIHASYDVHFTNDVASHSLNTLGFGGDPSNDNIYYDHVTASGNRSVGMGVGGTAIQVHGSTFKDNGGPGILTNATDSSFDGNTALGNAASAPPPFNYDVIDFNPGCDSNRWEGNRFGTANQSCIH